MVVVPMVIVAALAILLLWETFDMNSSMQRIDHADRVIEQSGQLLKLLVDMESGKRGYLQTGYESFLQPYLQGTTKFDPEYKVLFQLVADNPQQQQRLNAVYLGYQETEKYDNRIIALRRAGKADPSLLDNQLRKRSMDKLREQIAEFQSVEEALRIKRVEDAHQRWILMVISFLGLGLGAGVFLALFTRYNVEKLGTKLLQSEERWTATLGSIGDAVIATDLSFNIASWNPQAEKMYGWKAEEVIGKPIKDVVRSEFSDEQRSAIYNKVAEGKALPVEVKQYAKDGREMVSDCYSMPIKDASGIIKGYVTVNRDITERKRMEDAQLFNPGTYRIYF